MPKPPTILLLVLALSTAQSIAADRYVSTTGSNGNPGTIDQPYRNIDFAADRANPGDNIFVRGGEYRERVTPVRSGTLANRIAIRNYPGESPIIDGTGQSVGGETALIDIGGRSYLTFDGFQIRNLITTTNSHTPIGILIDGASIGIEILNCEIYNIRNDGSNGNAHGLIVAGTSATPISSLIIRGNEIRDLVLGNSEALVLNGNVDGFEVSENHVHDCNNLGIDFIGFEGRGPSGQDQARNGVCRDNVVANISTINNPAYNAYTAGGIYVDGGRDIVIERNRVSFCDIGIEVASEDPTGSTSNITVRNNLIWRNLMGGIFVGGYNSNRGSANHVKIMGNTLYENDTTGQYNGEILVQFNTSHLDIRNNIMIAGTEKVFVIVNNGNNTGITLDFNLYYSASATNQSSSEWIWNGNFRGSFSSWKSNSGQDANSLYTNPMFTDASGFDFTIQTSSPARDAGDPSFTAAPGETDAFGKPRLSNNRVDIAADEYLQLSGLERWRLLHFGTTANSGDAADSADPDCDNLINLLEFALAGQDPEAPTPGEIVTSTGPGMIFTRNPDASADVNYLISGSPDLASWLPLAVRAADGAWIPISGTTISESTVESVFSDLRPGLVSPYFYKLEITTP